MDVQNSWGSHDPKTVLLRDINAIHDPAHADAGASFEFQDFLWRDTHLLAPNLKKSDYDAFANEYEKMRKEGKVLGFKDLIFFLAANLEHAQLSPEHRERMLKLVIGLYCEKIVKPLFDTYFKAKYGITQVRIADLTSGTAYLKVSEEDGGAEAGNYIIVDGNHFDPARWDLE